ncbi:MAG TPA: efflux RND transporter periplasmic adaptor subunit [Limnobacter sp.]|nr:efflux RND transporter periplasmic adaptor subunit [Limnobacter sp.]
MKKLHTAGALLFLGVIAGGGYGLWALGMSQGMQMMSEPIGPAEGSAQTTPDNPANWTIPQGEAATRRHMDSGIKAGDVDPQTGLVVQYYHDPMVPGRKFDAPGKSPFMDMMLVPAYSGAEAADASSVQISPRVQQNLGIRTAPVTRGMLSAQLIANGAVQWNERERVVIQSRATGFVEKLHVSAVLDSVRAGQTIATVYVPDWVAAQEEFLAISRMSGEGLQALLDASRQRMLQVGMSEAQIRLVERTGAVQARLGIVAPRAGVVTSLMVREGMTVQPGDTLVEINGLSTVWVQAELPEAQAARIRPGVAITASAQALPGVQFEGTVQTVLPQVNTNTRTVLARMVLNNPQRRLLPGMFVQATFASEARPETLIVPSEAVIKTGRRAVVMLAGEDGRFTPIEVKTGLESGGRTEVLDGLRLGQEVVLSGQFLIDSEASLRGLEARLNNVSGGASAKTYNTPAVVEAVGDATITVTHPPVQDLGWPEMTMEFTLPNREKMPRERLTVGDQINMEFKLVEGEIPAALNIQPMVPEASSVGGPR